MTARAAVIIVNYNAGQRLTRCLDSLAAQRFRDFETIVVDNASSDGSRDLAAAHPLRPRIIEAGDNLGFARANNIAAETFDGEWLAFLNPDAYPQEGWLEALMDAAARHPDADAFGSTQLDAAAPDRLDGAGDAYHVFGASYRSFFGWPTSALPPEGECFAPCAAAALYRTAVFKDLGGFDERYFCYSEDVDLGFRLRLAGGRAVQVASAVVLHEGSGVSGKRSAFTVYYGHRNRIWTYCKNMPAPLLLAGAPFHAALNVYLLFRMIAVGRGTSYLRALFDAYRGLGAFREDRRRLAATRRASLRDIAGALTWSPVKLWSRRARTIKR